MAKTTVRTSSRYEEKESFSRAVVVDDWIYLSNTSGRDYAKQVMPDSVAGQTRQALENISRSLEAVGSSMEDVVRRLVVIPDPANAPEVMAIIGERMAGINPVNTVLCSPLGGPEYLVEIEVTARRGAGSMPVETIRI